MNACPFSSYPIFENNANYSNKITFTRATPSASCMTLSI